MLMTNGIGASIGTFSSPAPVWSTKLVYAPGLDATRQTPAGANHGLYSPHTPWQWQFCCLDIQESRKDREETIAEEEARIGGCHRAWRPTQMSDNPSIPYDDKILCPDIKQTLTLPEGESVHCCRVLRLSEGDDVEAG